MPDSRAIDIEAAQWVVRAAAGRLSPPDLAELEAWLSADSRHRGAYVRAQAAWVDLDRLTALSPSDPDLTVQTPEPTLGSPTNTRRTFLAAGLSAVALTGAGGAWWIWRRSGEVYEAGVGELRRITLPDGSSMLLNTATRARVRFESTQREIDLLQGEGLFEVAKDPARPFIVHAKGVSVRAVGTVFAVRAVDQNVAVTVSEGVVEVGDTNRADSAMTQRLGASEQALVSESQGVHVASLTATQVQRRLAWQDGMLSFDGESLADAVAEINRHNRRQIHIDDERLAQRPVVGLFRASDTDGFAQTVATAMGVESRVQDDGIHLYSGTQR